MSDILTVLDRQPVRSERRLSPIQKWALDYFVGGLMNERDLTTADLTCAFGGLATLADSGLAIAMRRFLATNDPHRLEPLYARDPFSWRIEGPDGFAGTISNTSDAIPLGTGELQVFNVAAMPFPSSIEGTWYDGKGYIAQEEYGDTLRGYIQLDPLLLVHVDPEMNSALLDLQRTVACKLLEIARPLVRTDVTCHSGNFGRLWQFSGPVGLLSQTPPPFSTLPGGDIYLTDGRGGHWGEERLIVRKPDDTQTNLRALDLLVKKLIGKHLTTNPVVEELVPKGFFGGLFGREEWKTSTYPSPMAQLEDACMGLQDGLNDLGIDHVTSAAVAYSWLIGLKCAAQNVGIPT